MAVESADHVEKLIGLKTLSGNDVGERKISDEKDGTIFEEALNGAVALGEVDPTRCRILVERMTVMMRGSGVKIMNEMVFDKVARNGDGKFGEKGVKVCL